MPELLLFIISFLLVLSSSYFLATLLNPKKYELLVIYLILILISQVIISIEILSILKQVNPTGLLIINLIVFFATVKTARYPELVSGFLKIKIALPQIFNKAACRLVSRRGLMEAALPLFFIFSSLISLFLSIVAPTNSGDSMVYHLARIGFWIQNNTLAHFETGILRQTAFPINSEILLLWSMVFLKRDYLAIINQYLAYWGNLFVLFSFLRYLKISLRRTLWAVFILGSLPALILESMSTQTNLIMGFLLFSSLYLFIYASNENDKKAYIFSAIAFSLALGVKSTALLFSPAFITVYLLILNKNKEKKFKQGLTVFIPALIISFLILSSYNYILNYIDYGNPLGTQALIELHKAPLSIKAFTANLIRYLFLFVDFTGMKTLDVLSPHIMSLKSNIFMLLHLKTTDGIVFQDMPKINTLIHENFSTFGLLGFVWLSQCLRHILRLPILPKTVIASIAKQSKTKRDVILSDRRERENPSNRHSGINRNKIRSKTIYYTALIFVIFLITISLTGFCYWYNRFFTTAIIISSPVLILSYTRKTTVLKATIIMLAVFNYLIIPTCNLSKPFFWIIKNMPVYGYFIHPPLTPPSREGNETRVGLRPTPNPFLNLRNEIRLRSETDIKRLSPYYYIVKNLGIIAPNNSKIALIFSDNEWFYPFFEENPTWKIFPVRYELLLKNNNYNDYDFIVISGKTQIIDTLNKNKNKNNKNTMQYNKIDFSKIPNNFKLLKIINIKATTDSEEKIFYVYATKAHSKASNHS
ncbi:MAG: glycosyltransferase family 39 protein [bacterium]